MKQRLNTAQAFTLTEVIVGLVVVTIIGVASWAAVNVLGTTSQATTLRVKAEHLITLTQEELHQYLQIQSNFDNIAAGWPATGNCTLDVPGNACGFADVADQFSPITRTLTYLAADSTTGIKKFEVHLSWAESGTTQVLDSVITLVRPSDPLPGNIYGLVTNSTTGQVVGNVQIVVQNLTTPATNTTVSQAAAQQQGANKFNYTFAQPGTGYFILGAGNWRLTATAAGYNNYIYPQNIVVNGADPVEVDFQMVPLLTPATITGSLVNANPGGPQPSFKNSSIIQLDEGGVSPGNVSPLTTNNSSFNFTVNFSTPNKRCFTLSTLRAYQSAWAGQFNWNNFSYQANGWSSAAANDPSQAWAGNADGSGDQYICVVPGQTFPQNIPLVPVPTATVTALVVDQTGKAINASSSNQVWFYVYWNDGTLYSYQDFTASMDGQGHYLVTVPAAQDMFPVGANVQIDAWTTVPVLKCCNQTSTVTLHSPVQMVGPLPPNQSTTLTINTSTAPQQCGDAGGLVDNAQTGASLGGAVVDLAGINQGTGGTGDYSFQCSSTPPYQIPAGNSNITATDTGYYPFSSSGNSFYNATALANIFPNQVNILGPIGLWPIGYGMITGTVVEVEQGVDIPMSGVPVVLTLLGGSGGTLTATTQSDGTFEFDNIRETWPPTALCPNGVCPSNYNSTPLDHSLSVAATSSYGAYRGSSFILTAGKTYNTTIVLVPTEGV